MLHTEEYIYFQKTSSFNTVKQLHPPRESFNRFTAAENQDNKEAAVTKHL